MKPSLMYNLDQIEESKILPADRIAEIKAKIKSLSCHAFTHDGKEITGIVIAPTVNGNCIFNTNNGDTVSYMERCILAYLLTAEEIQLINNDLGDALDDARDTRDYNAALASGHIVKADDYHGKILFDDQVFDGIDEMVEYYDGVDEIPDWLFAAKPRKMIEGDLFNDVMQMILDGYSDLDADENWFESTPEFKAACDAFVKANDNTLIYWEDRETVIDLKEFKAKYKADHANDLESDDIQESSDAVTGCGDL